MFLTFILRHPSALVAWDTHLYGGRISVLLTAPHTTTFPHAFVLPIHFLRISPLLLVPLCCLLPTCVRIRHPLLVKERAYYPVSWSVRLRFSMHFVEEGGLEPLPSGNYTQGMLLGYVHYPCLIQPDALPTELFPPKLFHCYGFKVTSELLSGLVDGSFVSISDLVHVATC